MFEFKLQIGCLIIVWFFTMIYIRGTLDKKVSCRPLFETLLGVTPIAIIFDGLSAWTVNHMDIVSDGINRFVHGVFFVLMDIVLILVFIYMVDQTIGIISRKMMFVLSMPGMLSILSVLIFMDKLYFVYGKSTNYSMGIPVSICFGSLFLHFFVTFLLIVIKHRSIEKNKMINVVGFMTLSLGVMIVQLLFPEILISCMVPTISVIGFYLCFEDPSLRRLKQYNEDMVTGFATLVENRDNSTGGHILRTKGYVGIILNELKKDPEYGKVLTKDYTDNTLNAAPLHDIGKIATPDYILQKPGRLTEEEYAIMKEHARIGGEIIKETFADLDEPEYQKIAYEVARHHHEKWNGKGYPDGLKQEEIPLHARIMAIADVFDAVSAKRCYRDAMPIEKCFKIIEEGAGTDFDPKLASAFLNAREEVLKYYEDI